MIDCRSKVSDAVDDYIFHIESIKPLKHIDQFHNYDGPSLIDDPTEYKKVNYTHKDEEYINNIEIIIQ